MDLQALADRTEIRELLVRYAYAFRTRQFDLLDDAFTDGATIDYTALGGSVAYWADTKAFVGGFIGSVHLFHLLIGDMTLSVAPDGATASAETTWHVAYQAKADSPVVQSYGIYRDRFARVDGEWRFAARVDLPSVTFTNPL